VLCRASVPPARKPLLAHRPPPLAGHRPGGTAARPRPHHGPRRM